MSNATARAYETIRAAILRGDYAPDERLPEEHLAGDVGVSRTPVREALRRLSAEGLVRFVPNQGAFVSSVDERGLREIFSLRLLLEPHAAGLAAPRLAGAGAARLRDLARRMEDAEVKRGPRHIQAIATDNTLFHRVIIDAADNARLAAMLNNLIEQVVVLTSFRRYSPEDRRRSLAHHAEIADAMAAGDAVWAEAAMRAHIASGLQASLRVTRHPGIARAA